MSPRQWIETHRAAALGGAIAVFLLSATVLIVTFNRAENDGPQIRQSYYYDLTTGKRFMSAANLVPPIMAPGAAGGEPTGVLAHVFSCGNCSAEESQFIGFIEMASPEMRAKATTGKRLPELVPGRPGTPTGNAVVGGYLLASVPEPPAKVEWSPRTVANEAEARQRASDRCKQGGAVECFPQ